MPRNLSVVGLGKGGQFADKQARVFAGNEVHVVAADTRRLRTVRHPQQWQQWAEGVPVTLVEPVEEIRSVGISAIPLTQFFAARIETRLVDEEALPGTAEFGPEALKGRPGNGVHVKIGGAFAERVYIAAGLGPNCTGGVIGRAVEFRLPGGGHV